MLYETKFLLSLGATEVIEIPVVFTLVKIFCTSGWLGRFFSSRRNNPQPSLLEARTFRGEKRTSKTGPALSNSKIIFSATLTSVITLPYLWFVLPPFINARYYISGGEILVILAETLILKFLLGIKFYKAFLISLIANLLSYFLGKYLLHFITAYLL